MKKIRLFILATAALMFMPDLFAASAPAPLYPLPNARQMYYLHNPHATMV